MELSAKMYMDSFLSKGENPSKTHDISDIQSMSITELGSEGMSSITAKDSTPETSSNGNDNPFSTFQATNEIIEVPGGGVSGNELAGVNPDKTNDKVLMLPTIQVLLVVLKWKNLTCQSLLAM